LCSASGDKTVRVWDKSWKCVMILSGHADCVNCLVAVEDRLWSGADDNSIRVWNSKGECVNVLQSHTSSVMNFSYYNGRIYSGGLDSTVRIWNPDGTLLKSLPRTAAGVWSIHISDGVLYIGMSTGAIVSQALESSLVATDSKKTSPSPLPPKIEIPIKTEIPFSRLTIQPPKTEPPKPISSTQPSNLSSRNVDDPVVNSSKPIVNVSTDFHSNIKEERVERSPANNPSIWSSHVVSEWTQTLQLSMDYSAVIIQNNINGVVLKTMTRDDWHELGVTTFGDVRTLLTSTKNLIFD